MISERAVVPETVEELNYSISGMDVAVRAPGRLHRVLDRMLTPVSHATSVDGGLLAIDVRFQHDAWHIDGSAHESKKVLSQRSALPQVAGAVIASILSEISHHRSVLVWRAAVVERGGRALVLAGDDWESSITLAVHLHTRGWKLLGGDYALVSRETLSALCFKKALHANSSCIAAFPLWYRSAVEASPWYSSSDLLAFYAINPPPVDNQSPWAERSPIRALLKIDGHQAEHPSLEISDEFTLPGGVARRDLVRAGVEVHNLVCSDFNETCDFIERWFADLPQTDEHSSMPAVGALS